MSDQQKAVLTLCLSFLALLFTGWFLIKYTGLTIFGKKINCSISRKERPGRKSTLLDVHYRFKYNNREYKNYSTILATEIDNFQYNRKTPVYVIPFYPGMNSLNRPILYMIIFLLLFMSSLTAFLKNCGEAGIEISFVTRQG